MTDKEKEKLHQILSSLWKNDDSVGKMCYNQALQDAQIVIDSLQEEPKECMYSKENYTDEDRKTLCEGCEEECRFNKKEEPVSMWHDVSEEPKPNMELICVGQYENPLVLSSNSDSFKSLDISKWAYFNDLLNLSNVQRTVKNLEEPVSEDLEEASKEWLRPQLDKSYANYGETKMMELTHFDGYAMLDAIEFGAKWQKEQDKETIELAEDHAMLAGMEKMKEELMAKAVEVTVHIEAGNYPYIPQMELYDYDNDVPLAKEGDKYKVVLIKEE